MRFVVAFLSLALLAAACGDPGPDAAPGAKPAELVVLAHSSFFISDQVVAAFEDEWDIKVRFLDGGDAGIMLNQAILTKDNPIADVVFGVDTTFLSRALEAGILAPYRSPLLDEVPDALELDATHRAIPIDFGDVCLNYDRAAFPDDAVAGIDLADLAGEAFQDALVVEDPGVSSPGLAFLLATIARFPEGSGYPWQDFWRDLRARDVLVTSGWQEAYQTHFSGAGGGDRPIVVSYASSPPAEVLFGELDDAPTGVITAGCFRQIEFAGVVAGTGREPWAEKVIDWMLSLEFQEDIPLTMFVFPARSDAVLPQVFTDFAVVPENPLTLDPATIDANRERWIEEWTEIVLR
jgi:thiamine transport system substrate-binding protein